LVFKIGVFRQAHEKFVKERYKEDGINSISLYCAVSFCPVLAAYWFCREVDSENKELTRRIESVKLFYGVTEVVE
jgi:hypothetical protein